MGTRETLKPVTPPKVADVTGFQGVLWPGPRAAAGAPGPASVTPTML